MKDLGVTVEETILYIGNVIKPSMVTTIKVLKEFRRREGTTMYRNQSVFDQFSPTYQLGHSVNFLI